MLEQEKSLHAKTKCAGEEASGEEESKEGGKGGEKGGVVSGRKQQVRR